LEYKWKVLTVTSIGVFMAQLDSSIIVVGLPTVIEDLNTSLVLGIWVITSYRLILTIFLVVIGRMTDIVGRVKLYNAGFATFTIASALCALSPNIGTLIGFRLVQGLGGALLFANSLAIVTDSFPISELGRAIGIHQVGINAGTITGYVLSGVMIGLFGWRSIFWPNVPIGLVGTLWCHKQLKELYTGGSKQRFDYVGGATFSTALTLLLLAMTGDLNDNFIRAIFGVSGALFVVFLAHEKRAYQPIIDLSLFKIRTFAAGNVSSLLNGLAFAALAFELTLYLQLVRGFSAFQAGVALLPIDLTVILVGPISGRLSDKYGARGLTVIGLGLTSIALGLFSTFGPDSDFMFVNAALAIAGTGVGLFKSPNNSSIMGAVPPERRGIANGVRSTIYNSSSAISIPLAMVLMSAVLPYDQLASIVSASVLANEGEILATLSAISHAFYALAFINALGAVASVFRESKHEL
jgi:EmrB/QacA subfamily drug resistance transporter